MYSPSMLISKGVAIWFIAMVTVVMLSCSVMSRRLDVGDKLGWTWNSSANYTDWASHNQFYVGDWLYFRFDKHYYNVLEVNKTSYENCIDQGFIKNITKGGRDVYQLEEARPYYFLSGGGWCWQGMKLAINVSVAPVPTPAPASTDTSAAAETGSRVLIIWAVVAAIQALNLLLGY